ncbi:PAS domain-containing protein, partial [Pontibacter rugosus]
NKFILMDELARLHALGSYQIIDTLQQKEYDEITELASIICGTPISLISLLDAKRAWFKSKVGITDPESPREHAFCHHTIQTPHMVTVIEDASKDDRFKEKSFVTGEQGLRFYAGSPLVTSDGLALGSLCVIDHEPRTLTKEQALSLLSKKVVELFELRKSSMESVRLFRSSNQRLFTLSEQSPDFITTLDTDLQITYANKDYNTSSRNELIGKQVWECVEQSFVDEFKAEAIKMLLTREQADMELKLTDGKWVMCRLVPLKNETGSIYNILMICTDITSNKKAEENRLKHIKSLEEMIFMVSHEVRKPVSNIMGLADLLTQNEVSDEDKAKCVSYMYEAAQELDSFTQKLTLYIEESRINTSADAVSFIKPALSALQLDTP